MCYRATAWAWEDVDVPQGQKLVLLRLADQANDDGECWPGQRSIAGRTGMGEKAVRDNLKRLEEAGVIRREHRHRPNGSRTSDLIQLRMGDAWPDDLPGESPGEGGASRPGQNRLGGTETPSSNGGAREVDGVELPEDMASDVEALLEAKRKVDGKLVTRSEMTRAAAALAAWNHATGQHRGLGSWLTSVVMRIRDRPGWDAAKHVRLVESACRLRWWERVGGKRRGPPTPNVVYGERSFEAVVEDARTEAEGREPERRRGRYDRTAPVKRQDER